MMMMMIMMMMTDKITKAQVQRNNKPQSTNGEKHTRKGQ